LRQVSVTKSAREKEAVLNVFTALMRPLMRIAFEYGISASDISVAVRRTYIQALEARLLDQKRPTTNERIALVAGLPKSDVAALRDAERAGALHSGKGTARHDQIANLLTVWNTNNNFSGAYGLAMDLDLVPTSGSPRRSFRELVAAACPGADEEALLDELVASESVEVVDSITVRCVSRAYLPQDADIKRITWAGRVLANLAASFAHNLLRRADEPVYLERAVVSDEPLSEAGRDKFLAAAAERGQELLTELDAFATRLARTEQSSTGKKYGFGVYFFEDHGGAAKEQGETQQVKPVRSAPPHEEIDVLAGFGNQKRT
jgi:Family of unknown function (DUF6502)